MLILASIQVVQAHDPFSSVANARIDATGTTVEITLGRSTVSSSFPELPPTVDDDNLAAATSRLKEIGREFYRVTTTSGSLKPGEVEVTLSIESDLIFTVHYPRPPEGPVDFRAVYLEKMPSDHVGTLFVEDGAGRNLGWNYLDATNPALRITYPLGAPATAAASAANPSAPAAAPDAALTAAANTPRFRAFIKLGVEHILKGYDHLLFLCGLLVACRRLRSMAGIITCFTLAHSITLALAALDVVTIPSRIVEPLIAASIVFVGVENLLRRDSEPKGRWALTFAFGLVHGFGFASALKGIGLGSGGASLVAPLFGFNLGVEIGQLGVAAVALPLLLKLRQQPAFVRYGLPVASSIVTLLGAYWLLQRTLLP